MGHCNLFRRRQPCYFDPLRVDQEQKQAKATGVSAASAPADADHLSPLHPRTDGPRTDRNLCSTPRRPGTGNRCTHLPTRRGARHVGSEHLPTQAAATTAKHTDRSTCRASGTVAGCIWRNGKSLSPSDEGTSRH